MTLIRFSLLILLASSSLNARADNSRYKYCLFAGYFGVNSFLGDLSQKLAARDGLIGDSVCQTTWKQGYEIGQRALNGQAKSRDDIQVMMEAGSFSDQVYSFIIKGAGL
jgi:hypothetical protein